MSLSVSCHVCYIKYFISYVQLYMHVHLCYVFFLNTSKLVDVSLRSGDDESDEDDGKVDTAAAASTASSDEEESSMDTL